MGAFEVSTVYENVEILLFSKMLSKMWPNIALLVGKVAKLSQEIASPNGLSGGQMRDKFQTTGELIRKGSKASFGHTLVSSMTSRGGVSFRNIRSPFSASAKNRKAMTARA